MYYTGGNIGIGDSSPDYPLHVASAAGRSIYAENTAGSGSNYGVYALSSSTSGRGVYGFVNADTGTTYGVYGRSTSTSGRGVYGIGAAASGTNYGVYGETNSTSGLGVYGVAQAETGENYGVFGRADGDQGAGVYGWATDSDGEVAGVHGKTTSIKGRGVYGEADASTGSTIGVAGTSSSTSGTGVRGHASASSGYTVGVHGITDSDDGWAGYFQGGRNYFQGNVGIGTNSPDATLDVEGKVWIKECLPENVGWIGTRGANNYLNVKITWLEDYPNHGGVAVLNAGGYDKAAMIVNENGYGVVWADVKNFRVPNPKQPDTDIWYACVEGPEAAAYIRGTALLIGGTAEIPFPDHFVAVAGPEEMTVQVTPLSADSKGLAVVAKHEDGFVVSELFNGTGTYEFDYTVMAVRRGHEDYQIIRPADHARPATKGDDR
jgi:hypothetical protein